MTPEMLDSIIAGLCNSPDLKFSQRYDLQSLRKDRNDLQSQLAAANRALFQAQEAAKHQGERADAAVKALDMLHVAVCQAVVILNKSHATSMFDAYRILREALVAHADAAPVPAQPAVVQDAVVRALIEAAQMAVEMIETEKHERRHVRWALKDALLAAKPADTEGRKDD